MSHSDPLPPLPPSVVGRDLHLSIKVLENKLAENPAFTLQRTMVLNLCSMYDLASARGDESKHSLHTWILKNTSDDFDPGLKEG